MAQVRIGRSLNDGEKRHNDGRKNSVHKCLERNKIHCDLKNVPNIAMLGSGGGERAMVGLLGVLQQLIEQDLMDTALNLSGVSGSTWAMAAVYEQSNWSSTTAQIKVATDRIAKESVSLFAKIKKLINYFKHKDHFSLTDPWAALVVPDFVKKIDETTLSNYRGGHDKDPYPIYTVIDQDSKYGKLPHEEVFFELTPHEAGYSLAGAFVDSSTFGCKFENGVLQKKQPEMDMTYIQGVCSSVLADKEVILEKMKDWLENGKQMRKLKEHPGHGVLRDLVELNLAKDQNWSPHLANLRRKLNGKKHMNGKMIRCSPEEWEVPGAEVKELTHRFTRDICQSFFHWHRDLETDEIRAFVKSLDKVCEKPPEKTLPRQLLQSVEGLSPNRGIDAHANHEETLRALIERTKQEAVKKSTHDGPKILVLTLELTEHVIKGDEWTHSLKELNKLLEGKKNLRGEDMTISESHWLKVEPHLMKQLTLRHTLDICDSIFDWFKDLISDVWKAIVKVVLAVVKAILDCCWIWGTTYNFLFEMNDAQVEQSLVADPIRHFEDVGLLLNSPFFAALKPKREIDLIISFDFTEGDAMKTVKQTSTLCRSMNIPFPEIQVPPEDSVSPKDFYVFQGSSKAPTVIHMPLFNLQNCGETLSQWQKEYHTFQGPYSQEMIEKLLKKAGENITNNKENLFKEIERAVAKKSGNQAF